MSKKSDRHVVPSREGGWDVVAPGAQRASSHHDTQQAVIDRARAVAQYQRRSMHKLHIAEWHRAEFERLEGELTTADFFDFDTERFLPAQAHADGALIQLAAGFDAFACAVAHHYGLPNPDRASLWESKSRSRLVEAAERNLQEILKSVIGDPNFAGLMFYRNLAAHRGVIGEQQRGGEVEEVGVDGVRFMLPDWLPMKAPDHPSYSVRPILRRYLEWGRPALAGLNAVASTVWEPAKQAAEELVFTNEMFEEVPPAELVEMEPELPRAATRRDLAPRIGEWRAWFEWGSHNFADGSTVPPAWYLQRDEGEPISLRAVGLELDELRNWLEREADAVTAKAVLWHYRPDTTPLSMGRVLAPRVVR
jgi:hypothetical protein